MAYYELQKTLFDLGWRARNGLKVIGGDLPQNFEESRPVVEWDGTGPTPPPFWRGPEVI